jgi:hypothetical protein
MSTHGSLPSEEPFDPDQAQMDVDVILAEPLNAVRIGGLLQIQKAVKILLDYNVAEFDGNRAHKIKLLAVPQLLGNVTYAYFQGMVAADLVAGSTPTPVNRIKIQWDGMPIFAKRAYNNMVLHPSSAADTLEKATLLALHFHFIPQLQSERVGSFPCYFE